MKNILSFTMGVVVGTLITWVYHKNKYEEKVQEEIDTLREQQHALRKNEDIDFASKISGVNEDSEQVEPQEELVEKNDYKKIINYNKYTQNDDDGHEVIDKNRKPFVIKPEEFTDISGFDGDTYYYHKDDVISDSDRKKVDNVEFMFGLSIDEIKRQFGVYEADAVYIRNMQLECDYEILLDEENYYNEE